MIDKSAYMLRISQASPAGLVVINFELILEFLNEAIENANEKDAAHIICSMSLIGDSSQ